MFYYRHNYYQIEEGTQGRRWAVLCQVRGTVHACMHANAQISGLAHLANNIAHLGTHTLSARYLTCKAAFGAAVTNCNRLVPHTIAEAANQANGEHRWYVCMYVCTLKSGGSRREGCSQMHVNTSCPQKHGCMERTSLRT